MTDTRKTPDGGWKRPERPIQRHERPRRCQNCGEQFPPEEVLQDRDELGRPKGYFCGGCI